MVRQKFKKFEFYKKFLIKIERRQTLHSFHWSLKLLMNQFVDFFSTHFFF